MDNYKHFIAGVSNVILGHVHVVTEIEDGVKPQVSIFVKLVDAVKYEDGYYHTYYKEMKAVMKSFIVYWRQTMDIAMKRADYLCHMASESVDKELMVLIVVNTIRLWQDYQKKFNKVFLPIESPQQQKIYDDLTKKFTEHMQGLHDLKLHLEKMDRHEKVVAFAKEQYAKSVELKNKVFLYAHDYISMLLADHLPEIGGSLKEILNTMRKNLKQLEEERETRLNDLLQKLYDKNKEQLMYTRQKRGSLSQIAEAPTSATRVGDIKLWLLENNIPFDETLRKPSLLMLVKQHKPEPIYYIDELLGEHGHIVLRLPPYHCDLNPIELIWAMVKRRIAQKNVSSQNVAKLAEEAFQSVTAQEWKNCVDHVIKIEDEYIARGATLYDDIDTLVIPVGDDSSSESEVSEIEQSGVASSSVSISGVEYLDSDYLDSD